MFVLNPLLFPMHNIYFYLKDTHKTPITITIGIGTKEVFGITSDIVKKFKIPKLSCDTFSI
jgi:hypothetical protein